jgi:hypothetical protein
MEGSIGGGAAHLFEHSRMLCEHILDIGAKEMEQILDGYKCIM